MDSSALVIQRKKIIQPVYVFFYSADKNMARTERARAPPFASARDFHFFPPKNVARSEFSAR